MADFGTGFKFHVTGLFHDEFGFLTNSSHEASRQLERLMNKIADHTDDIVVFEEEYMESAHSAVLAYGGTYRSGRAAVRQAREQGVQVGLCKAQTIWPFPEKQVRALAERVKTIYVPELNMGQYVLEVERVAGCRAAVRAIRKYNGEPITPPEILKVIQGGELDAQ
jgi:2-oxoglutarate ferredoxin oxidoreductase subunit alpha